jgi:hypothetical protein
MRTQSVAELHTGLKIVNMKGPLEEDQSMEVAWKTFVQIQMTPTAMLTMFCTYFAREHDSNSINHPLLWFVGGNVLTIACMSTIWYCHPVKLGRDLMCHTERGTTSL